MIALNEKKDCCGCHGCAQICPKQCITMVADREGFFYPQIEKAKCIHCGLCEKACPVLNAKPDMPDKTPEAWAGINLEDAVRMESSSGGVFTLLAEQTIGRGGVVFGAAWQEGFQGVHHIGVNRQEYLAKLRGSKYLQSSIGNTYAQTQTCLNQGQQVLFSGTPCQIEGLRRFLGKEYENLICVDIICYGVPAPAVWKRYLQQWEQAKQASVCGTSFRDKTKGWHNVQLSMTFDNGKKRLEKQSEDPYMRAFLKNASLRDSCYECRFKKINRESDLTIADFWGVETVCPEMDDDKGTSLILVHSQRGRDLLRAVMPAMKVRSVDALCALRANPAVNHSVKPHENREVFLNSLDTMTVSEAATRWIPRDRLPLKERLYLFLQKTGMLSTVKRILGKQ